MFSNHGLSHYIKYAWILPPLLCAAPNAWAQPAYPTRPLRIVVPFIAGGSTDVFTRMVGQHLTEVWKQPVVIDNRAGAASNIGNELVARATGDGYTLLMASPGIAYGG